jgi:two-component system CheB/CheR fusion protein
VDREAERNGLESGSRMKKHRGASSSGLALLRRTGGLEELLSDISDINAALVVVQHLSPHYESVLTQLLARKSKIGIVTATDGTVLEANQYLRDSSERRSFRIPRDLYLTTPVGGSSLSYRPFFQVAR